MNDKQFFKFTYWAVAISAPFFPLVNLVYDLSKIHEMKLLFTLVCFEMIITETIRNRSDVI